MKFQSPNHSVRSLVSDITTSLIAFTPSRLVTLAKKSGFIQRLRKLHPKPFVQALIIACAHRKVTFTDLAFEYGLITGTTISAQDLHQQIGAGTAQFMKTLFARALTRLTQQSLAGENNVLGQLPPGITRISLTDSSVLSFAKRHDQRWPGGRNRRDDSVAAQARWQFRVDLLTGQWLGSRLDPYNRNDRQAACDDIEHLIEGELLIRDLGYAVLDSLQKIVAKKAHFITRHNPSANLYHLSEKNPDDDDQAVEGETAAAAADDTGSHGQRIDRLTLAREMTPEPGQSVSVLVAVGAGQRLRARLVIRHDGQAVGDCRRRRLNAESKRRGTRRSRAHLALQNWSFYLTSVEDETALPDTQVIELYRMRWRVENLFRAFKSHAGLSEIAAHEANWPYVEVLLYGWMLMMLGLAQQGVASLVRPIDEPLCDDENGEGSPAGDNVSDDDDDSATGSSWSNPISLMKVIDRVMIYFPVLAEINLIGSLEGLLERLDQQIAYHYRYRPHSRRTNMIERAHIALANQNMPCLS